MNVSQREGGGGCLVGVKEGRSWRWDIWALREGVGMGMGGRLGDRMVEGYEVRESTTGMDFSHSTTRQNLSLQLTIGDTERERDFH